MAKDSVVVLTMVGALLTPIVVGASVLQQYYIAEEQVKQTAAIAELRHQIEQGQTARWVDADNIVHNCLANNSDVSCTITNQTEEAVETCVVGKLKQTEGGDSSLSSLVICTGRLAPHETKNLSSPWLHGFAKDICHSTDRFGDKVLDWSVCRFSSEGVSSSALATMPK